MVNRWKISRGQGRRLSIGTALLLLASCSNPLPPERIFVSGNPAIVGMSRQAELSVSLLRSAEQSYRTSNIGSLGFDHATLILTNSNAALAPTSGSKTIAWPAGASSASEVFTGLKPGVGFSLAVSLLASGSIVGSGEAKDFALPAGSHATASVVIAQGGKLALAVSNAGNALGSAGSWLVAKGDAVNISTGFASTESNVTKMLVALSPELYGKVDSGMSGAVQFRTVQDGGATLDTTVAEQDSNFDIFHWDTGVASSGSGYAYDPTLLKVGGSAGSVSFSLIDATGHVVGTSRLSGVTLTDGASISVGLK